MQLTGAASASGVRLGQESLDALRSKPPAGLAQAVEQLGCGDGDLLGGMREWVKGVVAGHAGPADAREKVREEAEIEWVRKRVRRELRALKQLQSISS